MQNLTRLAQAGPIEKLEAQLASCQQRLEQRNSDLSLIEQNRELALQDIKELQLEVKIIQRTLNKDTSDNGNHVKMGPTRAILRIIDEKAPYAPGLLLPQIIQELMRMGFEGDYKKLYSSAYPTCRNLVKQERLMEGKINKRISYFKMP